MGAVIPKLRKAAKGMPCTMRIPGICNGDPATTVLCHAPSSVKGMGNKSHDWWGAWGCSECHRAMDNHEVDNPDQIWMSAIHDTLGALISKSVIIAPPARMKVHKPIAKECKQQRASKQSIKSGPAKWPKRRFGQ